MTEHATSSTSRPKSEMLSLRLPKTLADELRKEAEGEGRNLSAYIRRLLSSRPNRSGVADVHDFNNPVTMGSPVSVQWDIDFETKTTTKKWWQRG
jgi:hypothetical protein